MRRAATIWVLTTMLAGAHAAAPVYRCGAEGHRVYSDAPCPEGKLIDAADPRSAAERAEAQRVVARERRAADQLERERRAEQATPSQAGGFETTSSVAGKPGPQATAPVGKHKRSHAKPKSGDKDFVAVDPASRKTKHRSN